MSAHGVVTCSLVYLSIGALIWLLLDCLGVINSSFTAARSGAKPSSPQALVLATAMMIAAWPLFVFVWVKGMART
jgi:hypothetical protein